MDFEIIVIIWLSILTVIALALVALDVYLYRTGENTRLEAMALRARLNPLTLKGNLIRAVAKNHTIPKKEKIEIDLSQFEVIEDIDYT